MKASEVLTLARTYLSDGSQGTGGEGSRWNDASLLAFLNECLFSLAEETSFMNQRGWVRLNDNQSLYSFSDEVYRINYVEYRGEKILDIPFEKAIESFGNNWKNVKGTVPKAIVRSYLQESQFILYPIIESLPTSELEQDQLKGAPLDSNFDTDYIDSVCSLNYEDRERHLMLYYRAAPKEITAVTDELPNQAELKHKAMLAQYVSAKALLVNNNQTDQRLSGILYQEYLKLRRKLFSTQHSSHIKQSPPRSLFD